MSLPKYDDFMAPTLKVLDELGGSGAIDEIGDRVAALMGLDQAALDATYPKSGTTVVFDRMSWARSHLKIAGLLASGGKGVWLLTDAGRGAVAWPPALLKTRVKELSAPHHAKVAAKRAAGRAAQQAGAVEGAVDAALLADEALDQELAEAALDLDWRDQLLAALKTMDPSAFERLCQRLQRESGFVKVEVTGKSGDGGIDGVGVLRMNLISFQVLFQCKRYAGSVSSPTVRDFRGAMQGRADKGLIITTGSFTADARREATRDSAPAIDLVDGELLCELLKDKRLGVTVREVRTEEVAVDAAFLDAI